MANNIKCPNCGNTFDVENVLASEIESKLQQEYQRKLNDSLSEIENDKKQFEANLQLFEEKKKKENELFSERVQKESQRLTIELQEKLKKSIAADFENQVQLLQQSNSIAEDKLKESRKKELEFLQMQKAFAEKEAELELQIQKKIQEERLSITETIRKQEQDKNALKEAEYALKFKEMQMQLEDQKKLADEMRRKSEQSSMQRQGEAQELLLEKILRENFTFDNIVEVGKGVEGADCIQVVRSNTGKDCGKIIYESKRTKAWSNGWIDKLKSDMRSRGADVAILVTQTYPKGMECFGEKDGIWVCNFDELVSVACVIRHGIIQLYEKQISQENKGDKMHMLYNYLTGIEFRGQIEAIVEGFLSMRNSISKERIQMEKLWKEREKQLEKVLLNTSGFYGSVKGIAGASISDIPLLDGTSDLIELE